MKPRHIITILAGIALVALTSCATTTTVTEFPDGHKITVTSQGLDPSAGAIAQASAAIATQIIAEK